MEFIWFDIDLSIEYYVALFQQKDPVSIICVKSLAITITLKHIQTKSNK